VGTALGPARFSAVLISSVRALLGTPAMFLRLWMVDAVGGLFGSSPGFTLVAYREPGPVVFSPVRLARQ